ncbi:MAG: hypothetical protein ACFFD4_13350 [Candidatus Odinarchaeota archaeon]
MTVFKHVLGLIEANMETMRQFGVRRISLFDESVFDPVRISSLSLLVIFDEGMKTAENIDALKTFLEKLLDHAVEFTVTDSGKQSLRDHVLLRAK